MIVDDLDTIAANSFRNFHARGMDYLCLHRSPELTVKAYFYERGANSAPEVVCPHDHRYPFSTHILAGKSGHIRYMRNPVSDRPTHECLEWRTPLNGGNGFTWRESAALVTARTEEYSKGQSYWCDPSEVHTITISRDNTVLLLYQHADTVAIDVPTLTYSPLGADMPVTDGLYDRMSLRIAEERLKVVRSALAL